MKPEDDRPSEEVLDEWIRRAEDAMFAELDTIGRALWPTGQPDSVDGCVLSTLLDIGRPDVMTAYRRWIDAGEVADAAPPA